MDKLPFAPVRFYPPALQVSVSYWESQTPIPFTVEFDDKYFTQHNLPIPKLKAFEFGGPHGFDVRSRSDVLSVFEKSHRGGKTLIDYEFTAPLPADDVPPRFAYRIHRITLDLPEDVEDDLPDELCDLRVEIEATQ